MTFKPRQSAIWICYSSHPICLFINPYVNLSLLMVNVKRPKLKFKTLKFCCTSKDFKFSRLLGQSQLSSSSVTKFLAAVFLLRFSQFLPLKQSDDCSGGPSYLPFPLPSCLAPLKSPLTVRRGGEEDHTDFALLPFIVRQDLGPPSNRPLRGNCSDVLNQNRVYFQIRTWA